ncbi:hypothetical protein ACFSMW_05935 [Virgibacillus halophilus]|uniref:Uncharacterized protein n=1 Tax=Tigheibacillus halophilus TaxID=361280 RepID=A0ABU5CBP2_9BACI|nr:hypothetical protein [Virgibacillus halophilus]
MINFPEEDEKILKRNLFLSKAIKQIEEDKACFEDAPLKINDLYVDMLDRMLTAAKDERRELTKTMQDNNLKYVFRDEDRLYTGYEFFSNAKHKEVRYFNPMILKHTKDVIGKLMQKDGEPHRPEGFSVYFYSTIAPVS